MSEPDIAGIFARANTRGYLHVEELGGARRTVSHGADEPVVLASVFKIFVLVAFVRAVQNGDLVATDRVTVTARYRIGGVGFAGFSDDVEVSWRDLAKNMMTMSDNAATDVLFHRLGEGAVKAVISDLGLDDTRLIGCCEDLFRSAMDDLGATGDLATFMTTTPLEDLLTAGICDPARTSASTPRQIVRLLTALWRDELASNEASAAARDIMAQQLWPHRLTSGFPSGVSIAAKTGTLPTWRNEAGVVTYPDGTQYAVAVFTRAFDPAERQPLVDRSIGEAAFAAIEHLRSNNP